MKKKFAHFFVFITLLMIFGFAASPRASGQTVSVAPTALYRFEVSYWDGGHLLTGIYQEGPANGYSFDPINYPSFDGLGIYVPPPGYTPDPSSGLVPLHRWTVIQNGWRTHYYYSTYYTQQPPDRFYNGIAGWVFPPGTTYFFNPAFVQQYFALHQLSVFYSTDLGFWNGYGGDVYPGNGYFEPAPDRPGKSPYVYQGIICALPPTAVDPQFPQPPPVGGVGSVYAVTFFPPPPPPPPPPGGGSGGSCNASQTMRNACAHLGGWWDDESCSCQYY
jgi:hypothetical protein